MKKVLRGVVAAATACTVMLGGAGAALADSTRLNEATAPLASEVSSGAGAAGAADAGAPAPAAAADTSTADYAAGKINGLIVKMSVFWFGIRRCPAVLW